MQKKVLIILLISIAIVSCSFVSFVFVNGKSNQNNTLAVFIYDENTGNYIASNNIPTGSYELNTTLSYCFNSANLNYNSTSGRVSYLVSGQDKCNLYFDVVDNSFNILSVSFSVGNDILQTHLSSVTTDTNKTISKYYLTINGNTTEFTSVPQTVYGTACLPTNQTYTYEFWAETTDGAVSNIFTGTYTQRSSAGPCMGGPGVIIPKN